MLYLKSLLKDKIIELDNIEDVIDKLYNMREKYDFISDKERIEKNLPPNYFDYLMNQISRFNKRIPLYNAKTNRIYLVYSENVYNRIKSFDFRPITEEFLYKKECTESDLNFILHYDINQLKKTFLEVFYKSFFEWHYLSNCRKPSFYSLIDHISPFYSSKEIYYLAVDWNLLDNSYGKIEGLCDKVASHDISAKVLLDHQQYIYNSNAIGLVKYYSLFGSYYINNYLRFTTSINLNNEKKSYKDVVIENQINIFAKLVRQAPLLNKNYIVYRFIENDSYLSNLRPGDIYFDNGFTSVTRNPFYYQENYTFGNIMIRIKLPKNVIGVCLCIESFSNFPNEEELILAPMSKLLLKKIITKNEKKDMLLKLNVEKKYEFKWISSDWSNEIYVINDNSYLSLPKNLKEIDFKNLNNRNFSKLSTGDRLKKIIKLYLNELNQFVFDNKILKFESYNSSSVYKKFFYYTKKNGLMITSINEKYGNIQLLIEIDKELRVNYYFKFNLNVETINLDDLIWIEWLCWLAYTLNIREIYIYGIYELPITEDNNDHLKTRYTYCADIYNYLKYNRKLFEYEKWICSLFEYTQLDYLKTFPIKDFLRSEDHDELFELSSNKNIKFVSELYIFLIDHYPRYLSTFINKLDRIYSIENNPFQNICYKLDSYRYLFDTNQIEFIPKEMENLNTNNKVVKNIIRKYKIKKFENRLREFIGNLDSI